MQPQQIRLMRLSAVRRPLGCVAEQPVLSSDNEGPDRTFGVVVVVVDG
jgi:hypothetical protein